MLISPEPKQTEHGITPVPLPVDTSLVHIPDKSILGPTFECLPQISQKRGCKARQDVRRDRLTCSATTLQTGAGFVFDALSEARLRENTFATTVCPPLRLPCIRLTGLLSQQCITPKVAAVPAKRQLAQLATTMLCRQSSSSSSKYGGGVMPSLKAHFTWADCKSGDADLRG